MILIILIKIRRKHIVYEKLIKVNDDGSFHLNMTYFDYPTGFSMTNKKFDDLFGGPPRAPESKITQREMDLASSIQKVTENIIVKLAKSIPAAGIILIDNSEFCVGGLAVPESENTLLSMWMNQPELARLARLIFDNLYKSAEKYES